MNPKAENMKQMLPSLPQNRYQDFLPKTCTGFAI